MPKLTCRCGEQISLSAIPCPYEFNLIWDPLVEGLATDLTTLHRTAASDDDFETGVYRLLHPPKTGRPLIVECPFCGRLAVFARASDRVVAIWYEPRVAEGETQPTLRGTCEKSDRT